MCRQCHGPAPGHCCCALERLAACRPAAALSFCPPNRQLTCIKPWQAPHDTCLAALQIACSAILLPPNHQRCKAAHATCQPPRTTACPHADCPPCCPSACRPPTMQKQHNLQMYPLPTWHLLPIHNGGTCHFLLLIANKHSYHSDTPPHPHNTQSHSHVVTLLHLHLTCCIPFATTAKYLPAHHSKVPSNLPRVTAPGQQCRQALLSYASPSMPNHTHPAALAVHNGTF